MHDVRQGMPTGATARPSFDDVTSATSLAVGVEGCDDVVSAMKILVVEDQRRLGQFLKRGMTEKGYTATWTQTCAAARDALCETGYDVIILDLGLPDGDGLELLREWRRSGFNEPVLILSARDAVQDRIRALILAPMTIWRSRSALRNCWPEFVRCFAVSRRSRTRCWNTVV